MPKYSYKLNQPVIFSPFGGKNDFDGTIESRSIHKVTRKPVYDVHISKHERMMKNAEEHELRPA